jgi:hypothetical protein
MLLTNWTRRVRSNESGSAIVAVLGVTVVALVLTTLITSSTVSAFRFSSATRAAVQSHAAADAGVAAARAGLYIPGNCASQPVAGRYTSAGALTYSATIEYDAGSGWYLGCPTSTTSRVRIVSTGTAQGVGGGASGNTRKVEAIFNYLTPGPKPSGAGISLYGGGTIEANSTLDLSESAGLISNGDLNCAKNNGLILGNVVVNGKLTLSNGCGIRGNATVSGLAALGSGIINGSLTAGSVSQNNPPLSNQVTGGYTQLSAAPAIPRWTDVGYTPADWLDSNGAPFEIKTAPSDLSCTLQNGNLGAPDVGRSLILDMRGCVGGATTRNNTTVSLTSDVAIFANQFNFSANSLTFTSADSSVHRIWFITPDNVADHSPSCISPEADFVVGNNLAASDVFATTNLVQAMLYTPCGFQAPNGFTWNGQIYAGSLSSLKNNPVYTYDPIGIAGYDLGSGNPTPSVPTAQPGTQISNRDLSGG